jgi:hypothetical protein
MDCHGDIDVGVPGGREEHDSSKKDADKQNTGLIFGANPVTTFSTQVTRRGSHFFTMVFLWCISDEPNAHFSSSVDMPTNFLVGQV